MYGDDPAPTAGEVRDAIREIDHAYVDAATIREWVPDGWVPYPYTLAMYDDQNLPDSDPVGLAGTVEPHSLNSEPAVGTREHTATNGVSRGFAGGELSEPPGR